MAERQLGGKLGPSPLMLLLVLVFVGGALVAAIVPLLESTLVLHNASSRVEVRLNQRGGFQREPSNIPGRQNGWVIPGKEWPMPVYFVLLSICSRR